MKLPLILVALQIAFSVGSTDAQADPPPNRRLVSTDELREFAQASLDALTGAEVSFTTAYYSGNDPEVPEDAVSERNCTLITDWTSYWDGSRFRLSRVYSWIHPESQMQGDTRTVMTWNGLVAMIAVTSTDGEAGASATISAEILPSHWAIPALTWQGWSMFQYPHRLTILDLLDAGVLEGPAFDVADQTTRWTTSLPTPTPNGKDEQAESAIIAERNQHGVRVVRVEISIFDRPRGDADRRLVSTSWINFGDPSSQMGNLLAETAEIGVRLVVGRRPGWGIEIVELGDIRKIDAADVEFRSPLVAPMKVSDSRYNIGYELGTTHLNMNGRLFITDEPLTGDVGENLRRWLEHGHYAEDAPHDHAGDV
ncbi:MAG: hypothetical protein ACR2GY_06040 [Phycisphaerales bacterium]